MTQQQFQSASAAQAGMVGDAPARSMLSRDADSMYWMARYVERAEHVARILLVNSNLLMDVGDLAPGQLRRHWESVLTIMRIGPDELPPSDRPIDHQVRFCMTFDLENPSSLLSSLTRARENARAIRESISAEMWENINSLFWSIQSDDARARFEESPEEFLRGVMTGSMLFQGLTDQTLAHDQPWLFTQVAKHLERVDVTARVIETKHAVLQQDDGAPPIETGLRNLHWMAVLRCCCSIEAYRKNHVGEMDPMRVATFLILQRNFPRSIRFAVRCACEAISSIRAQTSPRQVDPAERILGRLEARLEYAELGEIVETGLATYLQGIQNDVADAALAMQATYFRH